MALKLEKTDFGREMLHFIVQVMKRAFPDYPFAAPEYSALEWGLSYRAFAALDKGQYFEAGIKDDAFMGSIIPLFGLFGKAPESLLARAPALIAKARAARPSSAFPALFEGLAAQASRDWPKAIASYEEALAAQPDCYAASMRRAECLVEIGKAASAASVLEGLREAFPASEGVKKRLGKAYYAMGRFAESASLLAMALVREPNDAELLLMRAHVLIESGGYDQAKQLLDAYASIAPNDRLYLLLRARYLAEYEKSAIDALNIARAALRLYPKDKALLSLAARLSFGAGFLVEARIWLDEALSADPGSAELLAMRAEVALKAKDYPLARSDIEALLAISRDKNSLRLSFELERAAGSFEAAMGAARELLALEPSNEESILRYASILVEEAVSGAASKASARDEISAFLAGKRSGKAASGLRFLLASLADDTETRMTELRRSLLEDPLNRDALVAMHDLYYELKDYKKAQYYLKQALSISPGDPGLEAKLSKLSATLPPP
jgi:tetratricopeptide (TPR) repeat protein